MKTKKCQTCGQEHKDVIWDGDCLKCTDLKDAIANDIDLVSGYRLDVREHQEDIRNSRKYLVEVMKALQRSRKELSRRRAMKK